MGFWRWPLALCLALSGAFGAYRVKGGPVRYYRAEAVLKTVNRPALTHDLKIFRSEDVRREIASALGWIKPQPSAAQLATELDKLARVLAWEAEGQDRIRLSGIGKDAAGIAWVVNTAAKTTVACSEHAVSPTPWQVAQLAQPVPKPWKVEGCKPIALGAGGGALLGLILFRGKRKKTVNAAPAVLPTVPIVEKPAIIQPAPIALEVIDVKPVSISEPLSPASIYKEWKTLAAPLYASPTLSIPKDSAKAVDALIVKTTRWVEGASDPLMRYLAASCAEENIVEHVVHVALITLLWGLREGLPEEDIRILMWLALVHDMALKYGTAYELLRFPSARSRESAGHLLIIHELDENFKALLAMIVSKLGGKQGMQPAITAQEEKAEQLARIFTRLDRKEKILRRGALQLAKRRSLKKAV